MSIDIVVVSYRTPNDLNRFLRSLAEHSPNMDSNLHVVHVGAEIDSDVSYGADRVVRVVDNIGYARACNLAAATGTHEVIGLFNADIELTAGAIDACVAALQAHDDWAVVGPRQVNHDGRFRHAGIFGTLEHPVHRGWDELNRGQYADVRTAVTVSGSAYFIKRKVWDELTACEKYRDVAPDALGAFLPTAHYYEETYCSYHAQAHGHQVVYFGEATVIHGWHQASPVGGWAETQMPVSQAYFRAACDHHGIPHD